MKIQFPQVQHIRQNQKQNCTQVQHIMAEQTCIGILHIFANKSRKMLLNIRQIRPDCQDELFVCIKKEFNDMNWDNVAAETVKEHVEIVFDLQKKTSQLKQEATRTFDEIKSLTITQLVTDINERETERVKRWQERKKDGKVKGKNVSSEKNKKVTAKYSMLRNNRSKWKEANVKQMEMSETIDKLLEDINKCASSKPSDKMDVGSGEIEIVIPGRKVMNRLKRLKRDAQKINKTITSIVTKYQSLTDNQIWIKKSGARNTNFDERYESWNKKNKKRRDSYAITPKSKKKNKSTQSIKSNNKKSNVSKKRKRQSSKAEASSDEDDLDIKKANSEMKKLTSPPKKKRKTGIIDSYFIKKT
eukprot:148832_1